MCKHVIIFFGVNYMSFGKDFAQIPQTISCIELDTKRFLLFCQHHSSAFLHFAPYSSGWTLLPENALQNLSPLDFGYDFCSPRLLSDGKEIFLSGQMCADESFPIGPDLTDDLLCVPRLLHTKGGTLTQSPASFLNEKREYRRTLTLYDGEKADTFGVSFEIILDFSQSSFSLMLRDDILIECDGALFCISFGKSGMGRKKRSFNVENSSLLHIFSRRTAIEIFVDGKVFTSRLSDSGLGGIKINTGSCRADIYKLKEF